MGFFQDLCGGIGTIVGGVIGGAVSVVGDIVGSDTIREIGVGAYKVTANTGKKVGKFADGAVKCVDGIISEDKLKTSVGVNEMFDTAAETVEDFGKGIVSTANMGIEGVSAIVEGDEKKAVEVGKKFVKIAAISALSFSVLDAIDGACDGSILDADQDGVIDFLEDNEDITIIENPEMHHVNPHWRHYSDGSKVWVDGDGNSMINTYGGWNQHNPDYRVKG